MNWPDKKLEIEPSERLKETTYLLYINYSLHVYSPDPRASGLYIIQNFMNFVDECRRRFSATDLLNTHLPYIFNSYFFFTYSLHSTPPRSTYPNHFSIILNKVIEKYAVQEIIYNASRNQTVTTVKPSR